MFIIPLAFVLMAAQHVATELPSYFQICGRRNPHLNDCVTESVNKIRDKICTGIPELHMTPFNPMFIENIQLNNDSEAQVNVKNIYIDGLCDFEIKYVRVNFKKQLFTQQVLYKLLHINATYDVFLKILLPIATQGQILIDANDVLATTKLKYEMLPSGNKNMIRMTNAKAKLELKDFKTKFLTNDNMSPQQLREALQNFIQENKDVVMDIVGSHIERSIAETVSRMTNNIFTHFSFEEMFPDRE